ncbi:MAG: hypothetical protein KF680_09195 [Cryobacterium sp.]|nr:hypothetical protein [Cryobacterium sp.]
MTSLAATAALALGALTGCTFSGSLTYTVPASTIATQAEDVFEQTVGSRPSVDCGVEDVELVEGQHLDCVLTDPATGLRYEATVDLTEVDGTEYKITVEGGDLIE